MNKNIQIATVGGGCFWCTEAVFLEVKGVEKVVSGYTGGNAPGKPTYREVCSGLTGHAEVVRLTFDEKVISYKEILDLFFKMHDPTQKDMQYPDIGKQYRSEIFYENLNQKEEAEDIIKKRNFLFEGKIQTNVSKIKNYCKAEEYHQKYFEKNKL